MKYLVVRSFSSGTIGAHFESEEIELNDAQAKELGALVQRVEEAPVVETADLPLERVEKAVLPKRKTKKGE